jgi:hypothetical protein
LLIKINNGVADQKNAFADQKNNSADHFTNSLLKITKFWGFSNFCQKYLKLNFKTHDSGSPIGLPHP